MYFFSEFLNDISAIKTTLVPRKRAPRRESRALCGFTLTGGVGAHTPGCVSPSLRQLGDCSRRCLLQRLFSSEREMRYSALSKWLEAISSNQEHCQNTLLFISAFFFFLYRAVCNVNGDLTPNPLLRRKVYCASAYTPVVSLGKKET